MRWLFTIPFWMVFVADVAHAQSADSASADWKGYAGAGALVFPRYAGGHGRDTFAAPLLMAEYKETVYIDLVRAGVRLWSSDDKKLAFGLAAEPRFGFKSGDGARLAGMATRRHSLELGPTIELETALASFSVGWAADVTHASKGSALRASAYRQFINTAVWDVGGYASLDRANARGVNYYFGVETGEALPGRVAYTPGAATHATLGISAAWKFSGRQALLMGLQATHLGSAAANSPIVETRQVPVAYVGLGWTL